jgi:hypothetical protein
MAVKHIGLLRGTMCVKSFVQLQIKHFFFGGGEVMSQILMKIRIRILNEELSLLFRYGVLDKPCKYSGCVPVNIFKASVYVSM